MTKFVKGQIVKVNSVIPQGPVEAYRMDDSGTIYCLISWIDEESIAQSRWIKEDVLIPV